MSITIVASGNHPPLKPLQASFRKKNHPLNKSLTLIPPGTPLPLLSSPPPAPLPPLPSLPLQTLRSLFNINSAAVASWSSSNSLLTPCLGVAARERSASFSLWRSSGGRAGLPSGAGAYCGMCESWGPKAGEAWLEWM